MRAVLDTNVLIYAYFSDAEKHEDARKLLASLDGWVIPFIVLVELFWFGRGAGLDTKGTRDLILTYVMDRRAELAHNDLDELLDSLSCEDPLDWEDELILSIADREGIPLATFDAEMRDKAEIRGIQVIP